MFRSIGIALTAITFASSGVGAQELASPEGIWEISSRDSRYEVTLCGEDGDHLCGTLVWLGRGADNEENLPYLNTMIIDEARPVSDNQWRGQLHLFGHSATGNITQASDDEITLEGCAFFVICRTYTLYRHE